MAFSHGVKVIEQATSILPSAACDAGIPVAVGISPINTGKVEEALTPQIANSYSEAIAKMGYSTDTAKYPLMQMTKAAFELYHISPVIYINILDPEKHTADITETEQTFTRNKFTFAKEGVLLDSIQITDTLEATTIYQKDRDYTSEFDEDGLVVITKIEAEKGGTITAEKVKISGKEIDPTKVTTEDVLKGIQKIKEIYPRFGLIPGTLTAPGFSEKPEIYLALTGQTEMLNGKFKCFVCADLDAGAIKTYEDAYDWKSKNNYADKNSYALWPMCKVGTDIYYQSVLASALMAYVDLQHEDIPAASPSNHQLKISGLCLKDGTEVILDEKQANLLNSQGITTAINEGGWVLWGNRTAAYPITTDIKDVMISARRMFNWQSNRFIKTYRQKVDSPANYQLIETIVDSENIMMGGLKSKGYIAGGSMEFLRSDNPMTDLLNGQLTLRQNFSPYPAAEVITNILQYDPDALLSSLA